MNRHVKKNNELSIKALMHLVLIISVFISAISLSNAYSYKISPICKNNTCVQGQNATFTVEIANFGDNRVEYTNIKLFDVLNKSTFASIEYPYEPFKDYRGDPLLVAQLKSVKINITAILPKANFDDVLIYQPCFTTVVREDYIIARDNKYVSQICYHVNETLQVIDCVEGSHCNDDEFCKDNWCTKLKCKSCQYIINNTCMNYQCCSNGNCNFDQKCLNNTCVDLSCKYNEYIFNSTCKLLNCPFNQHIVNQKCQNLECNFDEYAFNNSCRKLNCESNEYTINHSCRKLKCKADESASDHQCKKLNCKANEYIENNACIPLKCSFFQDISGHTCINNNPLIIKLILELLLLAVITAFMIFDYSKFKDSKESKLKKDNKKIK
jgi:hypothetical protein